MPINRRRPLTSRVVLFPAMVLVSALALAGCGSDAAPRGERPLFTSVSPSPAAPSAAQPTGSPSTGSQPAVPTGSAEGGAATEPAPRSGTSQAPLPARTTDVSMTANLPGWKQVFVEDFSAGDVPLGGFPGPLYSARWSAGYKDGTPDTAGQKNPGKTGYYPSKVLSVRNGSLDWYLHTENGITMGAAPMPKIPNASSNPPRDNSLLYGRYSVRYRADALPGFKTAWLLWPDSGVWPRDGEVDFPEGDLAKIIYGAVHYDRNGADAFEKLDSDQSVTSWHVATMEWSPGRIEFFLDGRSLGVSTKAPTTPMHLILQTESCLTGCPAPEAQGHVSLDWISVWVPA
ncbi:Glycosyl hydrolases family 16 [Arthrobacter sp. ok909]|nr:Glycosyl hydrolases family 16 [Arthrobacter sp. ok909]